jgi:transcriptional regulator with XRE-family HTH domain
MTSPDSPDVLAGWGPRLLAARTNADLSRRQLAERVGVADKTIQRWEAGTGAPSPAQQRSLAAALNLSVTELFPRSDDEAELPNLVAALGQGCS